MIRSIQEGRGRTMTTRTYVPAVPPQQVLLPILLCLVCAAGAMPQPAPVPANSPPKTPAYDVVSIRPHKDNGNGSRWWWPTPDGYEAKNVEPAQLIREAYGVQFSDQLVGLPGWAYEETFDLEAKIDEDDLLAYQKLSGQEQREQAALMLRPLLADRFKLKIHHETKTLPIYALVVAKSGFKLKQSQEAEARHGMMTNWGRIQIRAGSIGDRFIVGLSNFTGRIVIDKTGLTGWYDIDLKWTSNGELAKGASGPTLFTALEEQMGLKLIPEKAPVDVLVVDHIERPSEN
jgi:uncharacterized protein (TIGR03435 family)